MTQQMNGFAAKPEKKYGVWHGAFSGRFYASFAKRVGAPEKDLWEQTGVRHDVTESVEAYIAQATLRYREIIDQLWDGVPHLDSPLILADLRNFLESQPGSGYHHPEAQNV